MSLIRQAKRRSRSLFRETVFFKDTIPGSLIFWAVVIGFILCQNSFFPFGG